MELLDLIAQGNAAAARHDWAEAERNFRAAAEREPNAALVLRGFGDALVQLRKFDEAEPVWRKVVEIEPTRAEAQQMLGLILMHRREFDGARQHLTQALALNPNLLESAFNLGRAHAAVGDRVRAVQYFQQAHTIAPLHAKALAALVQTLNELQRGPEAVAIGARGVAVIAAHGGAAPSAVNEIRHHIAHAYRRMGDVAGAADCYRAMIATDPADPVVRHLLAAAEGVPTTDAYAAGFAKAFFDNLAADFDTHLVQRLGYGSPSLLMAGLRSLRPAPDSFQGVLDLGCGTGLMAEALATHYALPRLVGIDLSEKMLVEAGKRGRYHKLVAGNVVEQTPALAERFDLAIAADVFVYLGDMAPMYRAAQAALHTKGLFVFTAEVGTAPTFVLTSNGHYKHNLDYLTALAAQTGFTVLRTDLQPIRKEATDTVMGHYIYLEKN